MLQSDRRQRTGPHAGVIASACVCTTLVLCAVVWSTGHDALWRAPAFPRAAAADTVQAATAAATAAAAIMDALDAAAAAAANATAATVAATGRDAAAVASAVAVARATWTLSATTAAAVLDAERLVERVAWQPFPHDLPALTWHYPLFKDVLTDLGPVRRWTPPTTRPQQSGGQQSAGQQSQPGGQHAVPSVSGRARLAIVSFMFGDAQSRYAEAYASMACYAARHGYAYFVEPVDLVKKSRVLQLIPDAVSSSYERMHFNKVLVIHKYLPHFDWVVLFDGDVFPLNRTASLDAFLDDRFALITQMRENDEVFPFAFWQNTPRAFTILQLWLSYVTSGWSANGDNGALHDLVMHLLTPEAYNAPARAHPSVRDFRDWDPTSVEHQRDVRGCHHIYRNASRALHQRGDPTVFDNTPRWEVYHRWLRCAKAQLLASPTPYHNAPFVKVYAAGDGFVKRAEQLPHSICFTTVQPGDVFGHGKAVSLYCRDDTNVLCDHTSVSATTGVHDDLVLYTRAEWDLFRAECRRPHIMSDAQFDARFGHLYPPHPNAAHVPTARPPGVAPLRFTHPKLVPPPPPTPLAPPAPVPPAAAVAP